MGHGRLPDPEVRGVQGHPGGDRRAGRQTHEPSRPLAGSLFGHLRNRSWLLGYDLHGQSWIFPNAQVYTNHLVRASLHPLPWPEVEGAQLVGIGVLSAGLLIKAIPDAVKPFVDYTINGTDSHPNSLGNILPDDPHGWEYCNFRLEVPQNPVSSSKPLNPFQEDEEEMSAAVRLLVGIALVIVAEFFHG